MADNDNEKDFFAYDETELNFTSENDNASASSVISSSRVNDILFYLENGSENSVSCKTEERKAEDAADRTEDCESELSGFEVLFPADCGENEDNTDESGENKDFMFTESDEDADVSVYFSHSDDGITDKEYDSDGFNYHRSVKAIIREKQYGFFKALFSLNDSDGDESVKEEKVRRILKRYLKDATAVFAAISIILTVMLIGQNYIKRKGADKIRVISYATVPVKNDGDEQKIIVNINTANAAELTKLPGIGESKAKNIVEYRRANGEFQSIRDIMKVSGIGKSTFEKIKPFITV